MCGKQRNRLVRRCAAKQLPAISLLIAQYLSNKSHMGRVTRKRHEQRLAPEQLPSHPDACCPGPCQTSKVYREVSIEDAFGTLFTRYKDVPPATNQPEIWAVG
eukprot:1162150-Pelagomonas_calceolata.AAC.3